MIAPLTARQVEVLDTIRAFIRWKGYPPTHRELGVLLGGIATNAVRDHLCALVRKGAIRVDHNIPRAIVLLEVPRTAGAVGRLITHPTDAPAHAPKLAGAGVTDNSAGAPALACGGAAT